MLIISDYVLLRTAVPTSDAAKVRKAMGDAGAGKQGNYTHCSGSHASTGRFLPLKGAHPAIGQIGQPEEVIEETIEMMCHKDLVENVVLALRGAHPYEEPPIDILPRYDIK